VVFVCVAGRVISKEEGNNRLAPSSTLCLVVVDHASVDCLWRVSVQMLLTSA